MNRRGFLLALAGVAAGGAAFASPARAAPAGGLWDELQNIDAGAAAGDLPAEGAGETQGRGRGNNRGYGGRGRHYYGRPRGRGYYYGRPRGRAYGYYYGPRYRRYRRRVCRRVIDRYGRLVRRCWWVW